MKKGVVFPHHEIGTDPGAIKAFAQGAESELGADHILIYDHVLGADPNRPGGWNGPYDHEVAFHEPLTVFAFMAAATTTIEFATAVLILPQRQTALVAKQCAELDLLSGGRFRLGVGTGWNEVEYEALNVPFERRGHRQAEQIELLRKLWTQGSFSYAGQYHTVSQASILPRPNHSIPIWFGGGHPNLLKRCGRLGDGWVPIGTPNEQSRQSLEVIRRERERIGKTMDDFGIQAQAQYRGGSPERWRTHAERWRDLGCTHIAVATHNADHANVDAHLRGAQEYFDSVDGI